MKCQFCHLDVIEYVWHPRTKDEVVRRYECIVHGETDETGKPLPKEREVKKR